VSAAAAIAADASLDSDALSLPLVACLAGLRSAIEHMRSAFDTWSDRGDWWTPLDAADSPLRRARGQATALRAVMPGHSRRVRLADKAVERVAEALAVVQGLPPVPLDLDTCTDQDAIDTEQTVLAVVERAFGAAERAIGAAATP
jgi:hypothetical protein